MKKILIMFLCVILIISAVACGQAEKTSTPTQEQLPIVSVNKDNRLSAYSVEPTDTENELTAEYVENVDNKYYFYYFYLGLIQQVPSYSSIALKYTYDTDVTITFNALTEDSLSNTVSKSEEVIDTHSYTGGFQLDFEQKVGVEVGVGVELKGIFSKVKANIKGSASSKTGQSTDHHWTNNWGKTISESNATTSTYVNSYSKGYEEKVSFSENAGFVKGNYYRMSFYETVKAYGILIYDVENNKYATASQTFLKSNSTIRLWEQSTDGSFDYEKTDKLDFDIESAIKYAQNNPPLGIDDDNGKEYKGDTVNYAGGFGTKEEPYLISNETHLKNISYNMSKYFKLIKDIVITNKRWQPLGTNRTKGNQDAKKLTDLDCDNVLAFTGTLDGNNKTIKYDLNVDLLVTENGYDFAFGLFGLIRNAEVKDLNFEANIYLTTTTQGNANVAGLLCGWAINSTFIRCITSGKVRQDHGGGKDYGCLRSGGLVGLSKNCYYEGCVNFANVLAGNFYASSGGIVGGNTNNRFNNCSNYGLIESNHGKWIFGADNHGDIYGRV